MESKDKKKQEQSASTPPGGFRVIVREFTKDKLALASFVILVTVLLAVFIGALVLDQEQVMKVNLLGRYLEPGVDGYILGTDEGGKDIFGQLIIGARNSIVIGFTITIITSIVGISIGLISGYYGGRLDGFLMRIVDFIMILPVTMLIIVFVTVIKDYNIYHFIFKTK